MPDAAHMDSLDTSPISIRSHSQMKQVLGHFHIFLHALLEPRSSPIDVDKTKAAMEVHRIRSSPHGTSFGAKFKSKSQC
jgi:hypothetical protein